MPAKKINIAEAGATGAAAQAGTLVQCFAETLACLVIVNLVRNGIEASPEGDTVTIGLFLSPSGRPILDVADNGSGIPLAKRQHIFDPFFTTKKEGTGLGLPIVKKIVEAHGWSLQILDNGSGGTIFRINLGEPPK